MASIEELKERIDLHDLADRLGLKRGKGKDANYHSPGHKDKSPSLSIFSKNGKWGWKDHSGDGGGSCIDLVMYVNGCDVAEAVKELHDIYGIPMDRPAQSGERREMTRPEWIAKNCLATPAPALDYLVQERGISEEVAKRAIQKGAVGWNTWTSPTVKPGEHGYGGPAVAFIVKSLNPGHVMAVDLRYQDKDLNGGTKTQCQGEKDGYGWTSDIKRLMAAKTVYVVESPINALSIECCKLYDFAAFAVRGVGNVRNIDWSWARGKQIVICFDNDEPFPPGHKQAGRRPGLEAAWELHEILTAMDISAMLVNQAEWTVNDVNDFIKPSKEFNPPGLDKLTLAMKSWEPWLIQGMAAHEETSGLLPPSGKRRLYLPWHHDHVYWRYRVRPDFTTHISKVEGNKKDDAGNAVPPQITTQDLCGFRIAAVSRLELQGNRATMTGDPDMQPTTKFSVSVQVGRNGATLLRRVFDDDNLHNIEKWKRFGPVFAQSQFLRMISLLEHTAHLGARRAANYVGLCWKGGRLGVNEGTDCYFDDPVYQCHYHNLAFPSGTKAAARKVIEAYGRTFKDNQALLLLTWALGGHLKAFFRFWPHAKMEADKGSGKSTLIGRLSSTIGMASLSGQTLKTEYRMVNSVAYTSHPVCWEEFSRLNDLQRKLALDLLQETYQFQETTRSQKPFLLSAPVLIAGEDAPVADIAEKLVRLRIQKSKQGPELPFDLPQFPVRQWLQFLADIPADVVRGTLARCREEATRRSVSSNAQRIVENYTALLAAWYLLAEFAELPPEYNGVLSSIYTEMNEYLVESKSDRHPWVWVMHTVLAEIDARHFQSPYAWDWDGEDWKLYIRSSDVMHHMSRTTALREQWNALPIKSDRAFKRQLLQADVVTNPDVEKTIGGRRTAHMLEISLAALEGYGLHAAPRIERDPPQEASS